jgi:hypothetical protein
MATLNENAVIEQWALDTFKGTPTKVLLPRGKTLFKLSKYHPINTSAGGTITQFWSDWESTSEGDWGWDGLQKMSSHFNVSEKELVRVTAAVKYEWNELTYAWKIALNEPVYGWHGPARSQLRTGTVDKTGHDPRFPGMNMQYYIPNLCGWHIAVLERLRAR